MIEEIDTDTLSECGVGENEIDGHRISLTLGASSPKASTVGLSSVERLIDFESGHLNEH